MASVVMDDALPRPFDQEFLDDLPYDPGLLLFDELLEIDEELSRVRCKWRTSGREPITNAQRNHPLRHPAHVSGALMVHATGMLGFVHAYYLLGLRHRDGWIGYGTHMQRAVFRKLVPPVEVIIASCHSTRLRLGQSRHFVRYAFDLRHQGERCYQSEQSAMWLRVDEGAAQQSLELH